VFLSARPSVSIPALGAFPLRLTPLNSTPTFAPPGVGSVAEKRALAVPRNDEFMSASVLQGGQVWDEDVLKAMLDVVEEGSAAIDVGANYGRRVLTALSLDRSFRILSFVHVSSPHCTIPDTCRPSRPLIAARSYSVFFSDKVGPTGRVYAFEPQPFIHSVLNFNLVLNDASKNVQTFRGVLGHAETTTHMSDVLSDGSKKGASFAATAAKGEPVNYGGRQIGQGGEEVPMRTLDSFRIACPISMLKVDAEGAEHLVFYGARETIRRVLLTLVPVRPRWRGERRSLRTLSPGDSLRPPPLGFNPDAPRCLSTPPTDAFQLHPDVASYGQLPSDDARRRYFTSPTTRRSPRRRRRR